MNERNHERVVELLLEKIDAKEYLIAKANERAEQLRMDLGASERNIREIESLLAASRSRNIELTNRLDEISAQKAKQKRGKK